MNINRNNYEEYFLLYTDNELSAAEKAAVDAFVQQNSDLAGELNALQQTVIPTPDIYYEGKELLFRNEGAAINATNCEEKFLLYVDNELSNTERTEVETFVLQHPQLQEAFTLINQTKLSSEIIAYPYKNELYKKEEKRIVYFNWQRMALAAVFIGLIVLVYNIILQNKTEITAPVATIETKVVQPVVQSSSTKNEDNKIKTEQRIINNNPSTIAIKNTEIKRTNNLPVPLKENIQLKQNTINENLAVIEKNQPKTTNPAIDITTKSNETVTIKNSKEVAVPITNAVAVEDNYRELNTDDETKNPVYFGNMQLNKDKLRGLIKKAGRLFGKGKDDDSKLAVASFAINKQSK